MWRPDFCPPCRAASLFHNIMKINPGMRSWNKCYRPCSDSRKHPVTHLFSSEDLRCWRDFQRQQITLLQSHFILSGFTKEASFNFPRTPMWKNLLGGIILLVSSNHVSALSCSHWMKYKLRTLLWLKKLGGLWQGLWAWKWLMSRRKWFVRPKRMSPLRNKLSIKEGNVIRIKITNENVESLVFRMNSEWEQNR
jgi:hypothetical protein